MTTKQTNKTNNILDNKNIIQVCCNQNTMMSALIMLSAFVIFHTKEKQQWSG